MRQIILPKTDSRYWLQPGKLKKWARSATYSIYIQSRGQRHAFTLGTANKEVAARLAAGICNDIVTLGIENTLAKRSPQKASEEVRVATIGEWLEGAKKVSEATDATFTSYARCLRQIAGSIISLKKDEKRFGPKAGGSTIYRAAIDGASLEVLSPRAIQQWRLNYVKKAKTPAEERSAMTTCNSLIRQARSLFAPKIVKFMQESMLPEALPFTGVEFYPRQSAKYFSKIDPSLILQSAQKELAQAEPAVFLSLLLALGAGLRKGEIDSLCWHQIDFNKRLIRIETTAVASLKTSDSRAEVEIDEQMVKLLQTRKQTVKAKDNDYVIDADGGEGKRKWGQHYRADIPFNKLIAWLKLKGVTARKPIHELRKELGAAITQQHGIYAASRILRHSSVETTSRHYSDIKTRPTAPIGIWLNPLKVVPDKKVKKPVAVTRKVRRPPPPRR